MLTRLTHDPRFEDEPLWAPDERALAFTDVDPETGFDIWVLTLGAEPPARPFLNSRFWENWPAISPDGRWVAYQSNETGRFEVYVTSFPEPGGKIHVSTEGGILPRWARDGSELFFRNGPRMMAAAV